MSSDRGLAELLPGLKVHPRVLFLCGALLFPPFLLQQDIVIRAALIAAFMVFSVLAGRRVRLVQTVLVAAGIVLFNLVIPTGRIIAAPLGLPITEAALKGGLMKATAMTGLIYLSQFSIRPNLRLPGRFGGLVGRSLFYFQAIMNERERIDRRNLIASLDAILLSLAERTGTAVEWTGQPSVTGGLHGQRAGLAVLLAVVAANWAVYGVTLAFPHPFWGG